MHVTVIATKGHTFTTWKTRDIWRTEPNFSGYGTDLFKAHKTGTQDPYTIRPQAVRYLSSRSHSTYLPSVALNLIPFIDMGIFIPERNMTILYSIPVFSTLLLFIIHSFYEGKLLHLLVGVQAPAILPTPKGSAANGKTENYCCVAVICDLCWQCPPLVLHSRYLTRRFRQSSTARYPTARTILCPSHHN